MHQNATEKQNCFTGHPSSSIHGRSKSSDHPEWGWRLNSPQQTFIWLKETIGRLEKSVKYKKMYLF